MTIEKRPARHEDTMVLAGISYTWAKELSSKLGRFSSSFAEITDGNELGNCSPVAAEPVSQTIYPHAARKSSRNPGIFRLFSIFISARALARLGDGIRDSAGTL